MLAAGLTVSRFVHFAAVLALFGGALFPHYAYAGAADEDARRQLLRWLKPALTASAILAFAGGLGWFAFTAAGMSGTLAGAVDPQVLIAVVQATDFGPIWLARLALIAALLAAMLFRRDRRRDWIATALAALVLASLAGTGHSRTTEGWNGAVHIAADAAHLIAAGVWLGGLWPLGAALAWAHRDGSHSGRDSGEMLMRFSGLGYLAVAVLVASGLVNSWYLVGSIDGLWTNPYGRLLIVKLGLFGAMAALAVANRFWITPRLQAADAASIQPWLRRIRRHVAAEQLLGLLVIAVVSLLGTLGPPAV